MKHHTWFISAIVLAVALVPFIRAPACAFASGTSTLTYSAVSEGKAIDGADISLYKVAETAISSSGGKEYTITDPYKEILEGKDEEEVTKNARDFAEKMAAVTVTPYATVTTGKSGDAVFTGIPEGVYLVKETGKSGTAASYEDFEPSVIMLPEENADGTENYTVNAKVKIPPKGTKTTGTVQKAEKKSQPGVTKSGRNSSSSASTAAKKSTASRKTSKNVKTGDEADINMLISLIAVSLSGIVLLWGRQKKDTEEGNRAKEKNRQR